MDTTLITCPGICGSACGGEQVEATGFGTFTATTVEVAPCSALAAQGWGTGPQLVERKSRADYLLPAPAQPVRHSAGLVTFQ